MALVLVALATGAVAGGSSAGRLENRPVALVASVLLLCRCSLCRHLGTA
jgi:hypothetical protein